MAVVLEPVSGRGLVHPDGVQLYRRLRESERLPVGTTVDAQEGAVRVIVARDDAGGRWRAVFSEGKFTVTQTAKGDPVTTLSLTGPSFRDKCGEAAAARRKPRRVRRLWGDGHGRFRTAGRYSAATVRGTRWLVEDRCDGTLTRVKRGQVEIEDFTTERPEPAPTPGGGTDRLPPRRRPSPRTASPPGSWCSVAAPTSRVQGPDVPWVEIFAVLLVSHAVGDFLIQTNWQATTSARASGAIRSAAARSSRTRSRYSLCFAPALAWLAGDLGAGGTAALAAGSSSPTSCRTTGGCSARTCGRSSTPSRSPAC